MSLFGTYAPATQTVSPPLVQTAYAPAPRSAPPSPRPDLDRPDLNQTTAPLTTPNDQDKNNFDPEAKGAAEADFTFWDFLDIINPLQHIPVVNSLYREITGDEISTASRLVGGTLYGGPLGFASALANELVRDHTGKDIGENVIALFTDDDTEQVPQTPTATAVADNNGSNGGFTDSQIRTAGEVFPQFAMNMSGPSGIPNAPPPRPDGTADRPSGLPDDTGATARVIERAPLPDVSQPTTTQTAVPQDDPRLKPRGPLFTTEPGFSPYNRPDTTAAASTAAPVTAAAPAPKPEPRPGINAQSSHPYLDLGPTAMPNAAVGRLGGSQPKIVTELQKPPVMPQGLMGGVGAMPGLPGAASGGSNALSALTAGAGGMPGMTAPMPSVPGANPMSDLQQGWSQATPGLDAATPTPVAFEKAMFMALNKYDQMQAEKGQPGTQSGLSDDATAVK